MSKSSDGERLGFAVFCGLAAWWLARMIALGLVAVIVFAALVAVIFWLVAA